MLDKTWRPIRHIYVLLVVMIAWVFFRVETLPGAFDFLERMVDFGAHGTYGFDHFLNLERALVFVIGITFATPLLPRLKKKLLVLRTDCHGNVVTTYSTATYLGKIVGLTLVLAYSSMQLIAGSNNSFIYFRF